MTTYDAIRAQYARNAAGLASLHARAVRRGRNVNGQPAEYWRLAAERYRALSTADDATLRAHFARAGLNA